MFELEKYGYSRDQEHGVWVRDSYQGIAYSDGDSAENSLAMIISNASDVSVFSQELSEHCTDWASLYHLSSARGNILRPFESYLESADILEIGAGCGAISRYLGECGGNVLSLEGSPRRAAIAASRTRDLDNVTVVAERFDDFKISQKFDVITLIGVLEYASMFSAADDPALGMLERIKKLLKPGGHLFIAIENQLGLKYFAGAPEDHLSVPMFGIEGRYEKGGPKTFGRSAIEGLIYQAGFEQVEFFSPFPDYKLPNSIITEHGFITADFDASALAELNVKKDPQLPSDTFFNLEKAWPVIIENGLGIDLSNSFMIAASLDKLPTIEGNVLAYHYSNGRKSIYCKEAQFVKDKQGISVLYKRLSKDKTSSKNSNIKFILPDMDTYQHGRVLSEDFIILAKNNDWNLEQFGSLISEYLTHLNILLQEKNISVDLTQADSLLPGDFIDAIPQNIVIRDDGTPVLIDMEWNIVEGVSLGHVMLRSLLLLIASASPFASSNNRPTRREFITEVFKVAGVKVTRDQLDSYVVAESFFQEEVIGKPNIFFRNWHPEEYLDQRTFAGRVGLHDEFVAQLNLKDDHINNLSNNISFLSEQSSSLNSCLNDKEIHIQNITLQLQERDTKIHHLNLSTIAMHSSSSWKITRPLRFIGRHLRVLLKITRLLSKVMRRNGGVKNSLHKVIALLRKEGPMALLSKLKRLAGGYSNLSDAQGLDAIPDNDYSAWIRQYDTLNASDREKIRSDISGWSDAPLLSILMPVYNPPLEMLEEAVKSVQAQLYPRWELCIADDASVDPEVKLCLEKLRQSDPRIKIIYRPVNGHISSATNSALDLATGKYVVLMDNDDLLAEHALYWVARTIMEHPDAALIYSDEDKIDVNGNRSSPYFKTDWNSYLFRSHNMISHLGVYRRDLVESVGRFRLGMEGSQDYDLALRCIEKIKVEQIYHIPRILYHWRMHAGSTAMSSAEKPYAQLAGLKALDDHFKRIGILAKTELLDFGMYRVHYELPAVLPLVSLIIPTRNAKDLVKQCIDSIINKTTYLAYEIILVDNGSDEVESLKYFDEISNLPNVRVVRYDGPFNYSAINNYAVEIANGDVIGLINNDIEVITPDWLSEMVSLALQPSAGAVGARLWYPDDRLQHGGIIMGALSLAGHAHKYMPKGHHGYFGRASLIQGFSAVTAACLIVRKAIFQEVGGLNEVDLKVAFNDVDLCLKINQAGYQNIWTPYADLYHHESATRGIEDTPEKRDRFEGEVIYMQKKWKEIIDWDPSYNPNLTIAHEDFSLAFPPRIAKL